MDELAALLNITTMDIAKWCVIAIIVLSVIAGVLFFITKQLYSLHKKLTKRENEMSDNYDKLNKHETAIVDIKKDVTAISESVDKISRSIIDMQESVRTMKTSDDIRDKKVDALMEAVMEEMADRIIQKSNYYIKIGGIPADEVDSYTRMYSAYEGIHGNHGAEAKYNYCMTHLPILPVERIVHDHD